MHEGNKILIQVIIAKLCPLKGHRCSSVVVVLATTFINRFQYTCNSYIGYDDSLNKFVFQIGRVKVKVTVTVFRKTFSSF